MSERDKARKRHNAVSGLKYLQRRLLDVENLLEARQNTNSRQALESRKKILEDRINRKEQRIVAQFGR